ncbi:DapH/DapD/GlmU-related protein [Chitinophagaceae bacterium MMS25-I14]
MISTDNFITGFSAVFPADEMPWRITARLSGLITAMQAIMDGEYIVNNGIAIHRTAVVEQGVVIKAPAIIGPNCFIGAHAYLRNGVYLRNNVTIGAGCEIKTTIVFPHSAVAHFNFIGDSIIGSHVNIEAGAVAANHYNERTDKTISVWYNDRIINTGMEKFGSLVGDHSKIGANAVLSPGTILPSGSIVKRLELVEQVRDGM